MILTAHQPQYLPGLRLFDKIARADTFVYLDTVPMESSGFENRNKIKTAHGWQWLTVPVLRNSYQIRPMYTVEIPYTTPWQRKHRRTLETCYGGAEWYKWVFGRLGGVYAAQQQRSWQYLSTLNLVMLNELMEMLGLKTPVVMASKHDFGGHKSELVLDMCKKLGATKYIFGAKGRDYAKVEDFEREGIELEFQDYQHPVYNQLHGEFLPNMSVVDLLMNCGPKSLEILVNK